MPLFNSRLMKIKNIILFMIFSLFLLLLSGCQKDKTIQEEDHLSNTPLTAQLSEIIGEVLARQSDEIFSDVKPDYMLLQHGQVKTMQESRVRLDVSDGAIIRLGPNTLFTLLEKEQKNDGIFTRIRIEAGKLWVILSGGEMEIETPSGLAAVRGSYLSVSVDSQTGAVYITCLEGHCTAESDGGLVELLGGQSAIITNIQAPPSIGRMEPADVEEWLDVNPEATVVVVPLTATVEKLPTLTQESSATPMETASIAPTSLATETLQPTSKPTGTPQPSPTETQTIILQDVVCYDGPGSSYTTIGTLFQGSEVNVIAAGTEGFVIVEVPDRPGVTCWVNTILVDGAAQMLDQLPTATAVIYPTSPVALPTWTPQVTEEDEPAEPTLTPTTDHNMYFSSEMGPEGTLSNSVACTTTYSVNVVDVDGVDWIGVFFSDTADFAANRWFLCNLSPMGGDNYAWGCSYPPGTTGLIYWRFEGGDYGAPAEDYASFEHDVTITGACP